MIYIYDIILNYNNDYIEYFEWNKTDILTHIRKIPIFKVNKNINICNIEYITNKELLKKIYNKSEIYSKKKDERFNYSLLLCTNEKVISFLLNSNGKIIKKSDLIIQEEDDILDNIDDYETIDNCFKFKKNNVSFISRKNKKIIKELKVKLYKCNDSFLKYLYIEIYDKKPSDNYKQIIFSDNSINNIKLMNNFLSLHQNKK